MTNQASEDELRDYICRQYTKSYTDMSTAMRVTVDKMVDITYPFIRIEKLKLLAEVRERVVGEDEDRNHRYNENWKVEVDAQNYLRKEQRENLTKLEAEL